MNFASLGFGGENKIQTLDYNIPLRIPPHIDIINYFESPLIQLAVHSKAGNVVLLLNVPLLFISFGVSVFILALVKIHPGFNDELDVVCRQAVDACLSHFFRNLLGQDIKVDVDEAVSVGLALEDVARCKRVDCCINDLLEVCICALMWRMASASSLASRMSSSSRIAMVLSRVFLSEELLNELNEV